jgi:hypothetical protein
MSDRLAEIEQRIFNNCGSCDSAHLTKAQGKWLIDEVKRLRAYEQTLLTVREQDCGADVDCIGCWAGVIVDQLTQGGGTEAVTS